MTTTSTRNRYQVVLHGSRTRRSFKKFDSAKKCAQKQVEASFTEWEWPILSHDRPLCWVSMDGKVRPRLSRPVVSASPPVIFGGNLTCRSCGFDEFRYMGRSLDSHDYQCLGCGTHAYPLTETGASA